MSKESFPMTAVGAGLKQFVLSAAGSPEQFGAPKPGDDIFEAGITQSQFFLPLVAEGRIAVKPWIDSVNGTAVRFSDASAESFDAILFGTGYDLHLPFLSDEIRKTLDADAQHLDLYHFTFHPEVPARLPRNVRAGWSLLSVLELQARWIAYTMSGAVAAPSKEEFETGIAAYRARRCMPHFTSFDTMALLFACCRRGPELDRFPISHAR